MTAPAVASASVPTPVPAVSAGLGLLPTLTCALSVSSLDAAIVWYSEHLGLNLLYRADEIGWCELSSPIPGVTLGLSQVETPKVHGVVLTFATNSIDATRKQLEQGGVKFAGPTEVIPGLVKLASFYDPDGNTFMLSESLGEM
jgi:predicted enzyme related to lactoylglutathione lyase